MNVLIILLVMFAIIIGIVILVIVQNSGSSKSTTNETASTANTTESNTTFKEKPVAKMEPGTGLALYADKKEAVKSDCCLEWKYYKLKLFTPSADTYDWSALETQLDSTAGRKNQFIVRFNDQAGTNSSDKYNETGVPSFVEGTETKIDGKFATPDWSSKALEEYEMAFYKTFAAKFNGDPRIYLVQVGHGFWGEGHLYHDGTNHIDPGKNYPSPSFLKRLTDMLVIDMPDTMWAVSIDASISGMPLDNLGFSIYNDTFGTTNAQWVKDQDAYYDKMKYSERLKKQSSGGAVPVKTFSGFSSSTFKDRVKQYSVSYLFANDYVDDASFTQGSKELGWKLEKEGDKVKNTGIAPILVDAHVFKGSTKVSDNLKYLGPGQSIYAPGGDLVVSDRWIVNYKF